MKFLILLILAPLFFCLRLTENENRILQRACGLPRKQSAAGNTTTVDPDTAPWYVKIRGDQNSFGNAFNDTAVLISNRHILTRAESLVRVPPEKCGILADKLEFDNSSAYTVNEIKIFTGINGTQHSIKTIYHSPHFTGCINYNNWIIAELSQEVDPNEATPICLAADYTQYDNPIQVVGFEYKNDTNNNVDLRMVQLKVFFEDLQSLYLVSDGDVNIPKANYWYLQQWLGSQALLIGKLRSSPGTLPEVINHDSKYITEAYDVRKLSDWICNAVGICTGGELPPNVDAEKLKYIEYTVPDAVV